jgi:anti-anti-sigma factor
VTELANLAVASTNGVVVATLSGEIDLSNAAQITRAVVGGVPNEAVGLVMDLSDVAYLDSAGVRMLAELERRLGWRSQAFRVVAPEGSRTRKVLSIAGLDGLLVLDTSVESASASMKRSTDVS